MHNEADMRKLMMLLSIAQENGFEVFISPEHVHVLNGLHELRIYMFDEFDASQISHLESIIEEVSVEYARIQAVKRLRDSAISKLTEEERIACGL